MQNAYRPPTRFSYFPPAVKNLLIINGLIFLTQVGPAGVFSGRPWGLFEPILQWFALLPVGKGFLPWQIVSYGFLHGDLWHLIFNMFAVWMFGVNLELRWGTKRFLQFYFICLVGAGIAQLVVTGLSGAFYPTVGASGAVFGILLAFGVLFPNAEIYIYFILPVKAKYFVLFYGLFELFAGVTNLMPQVAHFAHLGGMVAGGAVLWWWRRSRRSRG